MAIRSHDLLQVITSFTSIMKTLTKKIGALCAVVTVITLVLGSVGAPGIANYVQAAPSDETAASDAVDSSIDNVTAEPTDADTTTSSIIAPTADQVTSIDPAPIQIIGGAADLAVSAGAVPTPNSDNERGAGMVCKLVVDADGNIIDGDNLDARFSGYVGKDRNHYDFLQTSSKNLEYDVVGDDRKDVICKEYDNLKAGTYFYSHETITGDTEFEKPLFFEMKLETLMNKQYSTRDEAVEALMHHLDTDHQVEVVADKTTILLVVNRVDDSSNPGPVPTPCSVDSTIADENCAPTPTPTPAPCDANSTIVDEDCNGNGGTGNPGPVPTPTPNPGNGNGGGGGLHNGGNGGGNDDDGEVLGETSEDEDRGECSVQYLSSFLHTMDNENPVEVMKLQFFFNDFEDMTLTLDGLYNSATIEAVKTYQRKYSEAILRPWGITEPNGYVYIKTREHINERFCGDYEENVPAVLTPDTNVLNEVIN